MKKTYSEPMVEKIQFNYQEQVVASGPDYAGGGGLLPPLEPTRPEEEN